MRPRLRMSAATAGFDVMTYLLQFRNASLAVPMHDSLLHECDRALQQKSDDSDCDQADIHILHSEERRGVHDHVAEPYLRRDEFRRDYERPTDCRSNAY